MCLSPLDRDRGWHPCCCKTIDLEIIKLSRTFSLFLFLLPSIDFVFWLLLHIAQNLVFLLAVKNICSCWSVRFRVSMNIYALWCMVLGLLNRMTTSQTHSRQLLTRLIFFKCYVSMDVLNFHAVCCITVYCDLTKHMLISIVPRTLNCNLFGQGLWLQAFLFIFTCLVLSPLMLPMSPDIQILVLGYFPAGAG